MIIGTNDVKVIGSIYSKQLKKIMNVIIKYQVALTGLYYGVLSHSEVPHFLPFFQWKGDKRI